MGCVVTKQKSIKATKDSFFVPIKFDCGPQLSSQRISRKIMFKYNRNTKLKIIYEVTPSQELSQTL